MSSSLIGLCGYMRTGKDSVAKLLVEQFGYTKIAFADPLREMAFAINPYISLVDAPGDIIAAVTTATGTHTLVLYSDLLLIVGYERAKTVPDFRRFLQRLGTEGVRYIIGDSTWVDLAGSRARTILSDGGKVVFSDVRFPNEADAIRNMGGVVWRTVRPGYEGSGHVSETSLDVIVPDLLLEAESLDQLAAAVELAMGELLSVEVVEEWKEEILG